MERIAVDDEAAFVTLYECYAPRALGLLVRMLPDRAEAEDVLQDVMWEIWTKASTFDRSLGSPLAWTLTISRSRGIDRIRKLARERRRVDAATEKIRGQGDVEAFRLAPEQDSLRRAFSELESDHQLLLTLAYANGFTRDEISRIVGIPVGTVKTRLRIILRQLREALDEAGVTHA